MHLKYKIYTLGCKVNQYDSVQIGRQLEAAGFALSEKGANLAIINTCAVTHSAIAKDKRMVNKARRENPRAKIVISGCWPKIYKEEAQKLKPDLVYPAPADKNLFLELKKLFPQSILAGDTYSFGYQPEPNRSRYFLKIQDGCEQFCSYCIIPYTRGRLKSRGQAGIIKEIKEALSNGYSEIVLSGIHLGLYGRENGRSNLADLIENILKIKNLGRLRLSSIEVTEINGRIINLMAENKKFCRHLHIPLQSGANRILKLMNRPYNTEKFAAKIRKIRKMMPDIAITTDVIVGFPGETEKYFKQTYNFIKSINFSRLHIFPYSEHLLTPSASLPQKQTEEVKKIRAAKLRALGKILADKYKQKFINKILPVVVEAKIGKQYRGKTEYYFDIFFSKKDLAPNFKNKKIKIGGIVELAVF